MVLFLAVFPNDINIKDGMVQRIQSIDEFYKDEERFYLSTSFRRFTKKRVSKKGKVTVVECNALLHINLIFKIFKQATSIYIHSVFNVLPNILPILLLINRKYTLDMHGVVPEEFELNDSPTYRKIYTLAEQIIFKRATNIICVTEAMKEYYIKKYTKNKNYIVYTILPINLSNTKPSYLNDENILHIIYSGNTQKWQNIDLMCKTIKSNMAENVHYTILTGEIIKISEYLKKYNLFEQKNIILKSVNPDQLVDYYKKANYGFILRDNIVVNNVACPTKLVEYMYYGIIPIVLSENIGDFNTFNYDYINYSKLNPHLSLKKSIKNKEIIEKLIQKNNAINIKLLTQ